MTAAKIIPFPQPVRDVKIVRFADAETAHQQDLRTHFERGRLEGERSLSAQLVQQRAELMELQTGVFTSLKNIFPQVTRECEQALVALALEVARKLVAGIPITVDMIEAAIQEACTEMADAAEYCIRLNPDDLQMLERANSPLLLPQGGKERLRIEGSAQVTRGGVIVETPFGLIDGRRETKLALLQKSLHP